MNKILILFCFLLLAGCYKFKESNRLAIPPVAKDEIKITDTKK